VALCRLMTTRCAVGLNGSLGRQCEIHRHLDFVLFVHASVIGGVHHDY
jgi:hypothetical protein